MLKRPVARLLTAGVVVGVVVAALVSPLGAQRGAEGGFTYYSVVALADGVTAEFEIDGLLPVDQLVGLSSVTSEAHFGVGRSDALAALPDPGDLVLTLPGTLSGLVGVSGLPNYPAASHSEHPAVPEDEVVLVPDAGVGAGTLRTSAGEDGAHASAAVTQIVDIVGLLPSFSIGSVRTEATVERLSPSTLRTVATTAVGDLRLLGGLLRIDQITSEVIAEVVNGRFSAQASTIDIAGATIAGMPIGIGADGIVGLGQATALAPVVDQLVAPLVAQGIVIHTTPATESVEDGRAVASGATLTIEMPLTVQERPGVFALTLGRASASVEAGGSTGGSTGGVAVPATTAPSSSRPASALPSSSRPSTGTAAPPIAGSPAPAALASPAASPATDLVVTPVGREILDWQVDTLYRAMALAGFALLLAGSLVRRYADRANRRSDLRSLWRW